MGLFDPDTADEKVEDLGFAVSHVDVDIPEIVAPVHLGRAISLTYEMGGERFTHDFTAPVKVLVDEGIVALVGPISLTDLGIEEE